MSTTIDEKIVGLNALHDSKQAEVDKLLAKLNTGSDTVAEDLANIKKLQDEQVAIENQVAEFKNIADRNSAAAAFKSKVSGSANAVNAEMKHSGARILGVTEGGETVLDTDSKGKTIAYSSGEHLLSEKQMKAISEDSYFKAFDAYVRRAGDLDQLDSIDRKILAEGTDTAGGYLVPVQMLRELIMKKPAPTRVSGRVRRIPVSSKEVVLPRVVYSTDNIYSTGVRVTLTGEQPAAATTARVTDPVFGQTRITIGTWMMSMPLTNDLLEDSYFPLLGWATEHFGDTDRLLEDNQILNGTGIGTRPHGIFKNPGGTDEPAVTLSSTANNIDATQIRQLPYDVPEQYINENTGEATDAIDYQLRLADDFIKNIPSASPVAAATAAVEKSKQATLGAANAGPVVLGHAQTLETACSAILIASSAVQTEMAPLTELEAAVANAFTASEAVIRSPAAPLSVRIAALLAYRYARQAYDRAVAGTPTTIAYSVQSRTSLSRLIATVYGGGSRALDAQILALNRIPTPHAIPQGAVLRLPSPDLIKQQLRSVT